MNAPNLATMLKAIATDSMQAAQAATAEEYEAMTQPEYTEAEIDRNRKAAFELEIYTEGRRPRPRNR